MYWNLYTTNEIKPAGWVKRQLQIQAQGLSGNLDKVWPDVRDSAWIGGNREGWERVPYWLDGFIPLAYLLEDEDMIARAKRYMDAIVASQREDGWICPCREDEIERYDTWAVQLISKVLTVYYQCSKDERIPTVIYKVLKNYYELFKAGRIRLFNWGKHRWFEGCIAISFVYERWQEPWLLELAGILKEQGADYREAVELWKVPMNQWRYDTHIVNLAMMLKAEAVSHDLVGDAYADIAEELYQILYQHNGTPVELFTGDECLSGLSPIQGTELCSVMELMYSYELLYAYTGDRKWAERLEVIAWNAMPGTFTDDMWAHQYDQMSNQIACERFPKGKAIFRTNNEEAHMFGLEPSFGCCTANLSQGWPKFVLSAYMHRGKRVVNTVMMPSELHTKQARILLETQYPFENHFTYHIDAKEDFELEIRIPSFAENVVINGEQTMEHAPVFKLCAGESAEIRISFETKPYFKKRPHGLYTVQCGALVFSVPIAYEKRMYEYERDGVERKYPYCDYELVPASDWNYMYCGSPLCVHFKGVGETPFSSTCPPVVIQTMVQKIDWGMEDGFETVCAKVPKSRVPVSEPEMIELYPYGCAKLRMTELPVIE